MASTAEQKVEALRRQSVAVYDAMAARAKEAELPELPEGMRRLGQKLRQNSYKVLVVGEAKRGKSTFVNALIGQDLLPTDVEVATSQVFNVRPSEKQAYRVRFEDGSAREITRQELAVYGSQVMANAGIAPVEAEIIRWIEVDVPIRFFPKGVSVLDTPGLGALYAGHARITHRFVPEADAVIFVLESGQPVVDDDLKFIEQILTITRNIFFVQTKIDQYAQEDWQNVQRRNQEILARRFSDRLKDTRVWPVSGTNLRKAASANDKTRDAYLMVSRHKELAAALKVFLTRASGWGRIVESVGAAAPYYVANRKVLTGRIAALEAETEGDHARLKGTAVEAKQRFEAEWGPKGWKNQAVKDGLQQAIAVGKQTFASLFQPGSRIELAQKAKIDAVQSLADANRVAEEMGDEVVSAAMEAWVRVCRDVQKRCLMLLGPFVEDASNIGAPFDLAAPEITATGPPEEGFKKDYFTLLRSAAGGGMLIMGVSSMASLMMPAIATTMLATIAPFVALPALVVLVGGGVKGAIKGQVKSAQMELRKQMAELTHQVRRHFFDADAATGKFSRVDVYFRTLERTVSEQVGELVARKTRDAQGEIERLAKVSKLDGQEREARLRQAKEHLARWDEVGRAAKQMSDGIKAMQKPRTTA